MTTTPTAPSPRRTGLGWPIVVTSLLVAVAAGACADKTSLTVREGSVEGGYDGPLYLSSQGLDRSDPITKTGAAGQVVDCDSRIFGGFNDGSYENGAVADTAAGALDMARSEGGFDGKQDGYVMAREEDDRVLFT